MIMKVDPVLYLCDYWANIGFEGKVNMTTKSRNAFGDVIQLHEKVQKWIIADLAGRKLVAGETYSTEGELVERLRVGRNTVRKAVDALVADGFFVRRRRVGLIVSAKSANMLVRGSSIQQTPDELSVHTNRLIAVLPEWDDSAEGYYAGQVLHALTSPEFPTNWVVEIRHPHSIIDIPASDTTVVLAFDPKPDMISQLSVLSQKGVRIIVNLPAQRLPFAVNINFDIRSAVYDTVIRLSNKGYKYIGIINHDMSHVYYRDAFEGYMKAHRFLKKLIHPDAIIQIWHGNAEVQIPNVRDVTAWIGMFGGSIDYIAQSCRECGLSIPKDVSVIGCHDPGDVVVTSIGKKLSVIRHSPKAVSEAIFKALEDRSTYRPGHVVMIPIERIDRETS